MTRPLDPNQPTLVRLPRSEYDSLFSDVTFWEDISKQARYYAGRAPLAYRAPLIAIAGGAGKLAQLVRLENERTC